MPPVLVVRAKNTNIVTYIASNAPLDPVNAIENIASLGAKVIVLDYMFDAPDLNTTRSKIVRSDLLDGKYTKNEIESDFPIEDNDKLLSDAILNVKKQYGADVVLSGKITQDPNSTELYSILGPSNNIYSSTDIDFGLIDIVQDPDGFLRRYIAVSYTHLTLPTKA